MPMIFDHNYQIKRSNNIVHRPYLFQRFEWLSAAVVFILSVALFSTIVNGDAATQPTTTEAAATQPAEEEAVRRAIRKFYLAMLDGSVERSREALFMKPEQMDMLRALVDRYAAEDRYCRMVESRIGKKPKGGIWARTSLGEMLQDTPIEFNGDVAMVWDWRRTPLRKVNGTWRVDLVEMDYREVLTEGIAFLRAQVEFFDREIEEVKNGPPRDVFQQDNRHWDEFEKLCKKMEVVQKQKRAIQSKRIISDLQGTWKIMLIPFGMLNKNKEQIVSAVITVKGDQMTVKTANPLWNGTLDLYSGGLGIKAMKLGKVRADGSALAELVWSIEYNRPLRRPVGILSDETDAEGLWKIQCDSKPLK